MKIKVALTIVCLLTVASWTGATGNGFSFPTRHRVAAALHKCGEDYGPLTVEEGEVTAVGAGWISLRSNQAGEKTFSCMDAEIFVNGNAGDLPALRPIAPGFNFAVRLYFDQHGILRLVDGWYVGVEVEVLAVEAEGRLLTVQPLDQAQTYHLILSPHLAPSSPVLTPGSICFLLLDWEDRVRKILRPE
ncbi:MAG: hypothetical protein GX081_10025 [Firmicutes bacterium]|nr:hypothetical protein [Bacillota bacterium]